MTKSFRFLCYSLIGSIITFSLSCERDDKPKDENESSFLEDSSYTYQINSEGDSVLVERWYSVYDSYGRRISSCGYFQSWQIGNWYGISRLETDYNSSGSIAKLTSYFWQVGAWGTPSILNEYWYDSINRLTCKTYYWLDGYNKQVYFYSASGSLDSTLGYIMNDTTDQWTLRKKTRDSTDKGGNVVKTVYLELDPIMGSWVIKSEDNSEYDQYGNKKRFSKFRLSNGEWECFYRREKSYGDDKNLAIEIVYTKTSGMPLSAVRTAHYWYDSEGKMVSSYYKAMRNMIVESETMENYYYDSNRSLRYTSVTSPVDAPSWRIKSIVSYTSKHRIVRQEGREDPNLEVIFGRLYRQWQIILQDMKVYQLPLSTTDNF
jgi:hypothetical protein